MKNIVSVKELRENLPKYEARVAKGDSFIVMKRSKPIFRISPIDEEEGWETVVDFTKINKNGVPAEEVLAALRALRGVK